MVFYLGQNAPDQQNPPILLLILTGFYLRFFVFVLFCLVFVFVLILFSVCLEAHHEPAEQCRSEIESVYILSKTKIYRKFPFPKMGANKIYSKFLKIVILINIWRIWPSVDGLESTFNIGAVLTNKDDIQSLEKIIDEINYQNGVQIQWNAEITNLDAIDDTRMLCTKLFPSGIGTLLVDDRESSNALAFTSGLHGIPMIGLTNRESTFSDKSLYSTYMRTSSSYAHQADVWMELLIMLKFECVHFVVSDSINGRTMKIRFLELTDRNRTFVLESVTEFNHRKPNLTAKLGVIHAQNSSCRVFALFVDDHNAQEVLKQITEVNMTTPGHVWLISEQAIQHSLLQHLPVGFLATRYKDWTNIAAHMSDAINVISSA